jgi:hypothetical protein
MATTGQGKAADHSPTIERTSTAVAPPATALPPTVVAADGASPTVSAPLRPGAPAKPIKRRVRTEAIPTAKRGLTCAFQD